MGKEGGSSGPRRHRPQTPRRVHQNVVRTQADPVQRGWWVTDDSSLFSAQNPRGRPPEIAALIPLGLVLTLERSPARADLLNHILMQRTWRRLGVPGRSW